MSWPKKFTQEAPGMIFETQDRGQSPPKWLPYGGWIESEYQSRPDRIVKSSRRWITFSPLEWITFRALQTSERDSRPGCARAI